MANRAVRATTPVQPDLPGAADIEQPSPAIRGKMIAASYVRPIYDRDKNDNQTVSLEISFPLTREHEALLVEDIVHQWKHLKKGGAKGITYIEVPPHSVTIQIVPDTEPDITQEFALIEKTSLMSVEETGSGAEKKVIRLSFRLTAPVTPALCRFADAHYGKMVWLTMNVCTPRLIKRYEDSLAGKE